MGEKNLTEESEHTKGKLYKILYMVAFACSLSFCHNFSFLNLPYTSDFVFISVCAYQIMLTCVASICLHM